MNGFIDNVSLCSGFRDSCIGVSVVQLDVAEVSFGEHLKDVGTYCDII